MESCIYKYEVSMNYESAKITSKAFHKSKTGQGNKTKSKRFRLLCTIHNTTLSLREFLWGTKKSEYHVHQLENKCLFN